MFERGPFSLFYLVYVSDSGEARLNFTNAHKILDLLKKLTLGRSHPEPQANDSFRGIDDFDVVAYLVVLPDLQS
ncbi:hypothetical protein G3480_24755 [Thiorhodococcus mannitoliphagus]|uniref:Uncharacterized protein n=1 Tax=Thiorhodococcus mannitoliphagus TaxID=329406 RepID=A0A6P1E0Y8_9GAMM|nr:hypothetical protein [Thiorhodococcus mannitoliphagus]NEX23460.1 hypothetical protein [Thiorhodococcus mannitoliphagus]